MVCHGAGGFSVGRARWAALSAAALLLGAGVPVLAPIPAASAADCADAEVIFARGTDEPAGLGRVGSAFVDSLRKQAAGLDIASYAVDYKASKLQLHGGDGADDAISHIKSTVAACPDTKIVLGGYSQGASVINIVAGVPMGGITWGNALPPQYADNIAAVATFGNVADRTGGSLPSQSALLGAKAIDFCNPEDPICHAGPGNEWSGHTEGYVPSYTTQAAAFAAAKLLAGLTPTLPGYGPLPGYDPQTAVHGALPGYLPGPGYDTPGTQQSPGTQPPTTTPTSPSSGFGFV